MIGTYKYYRCMSEIVPLFTVEFATRAIREIAADGSGVVLLNHAKARGRQRAIGYRQVVECLRKGTINEGPYQTASGQWRCNVFRHMAGERMTCVVEFDLPKRLLIVTVY